MTILKKYNKEGNHLNQFQIFLIRAVIGAFFAVVITRMFYGRVHLAYVAGLTFAWWYARRLVAKDRLWRHNSLSIADAFDAPTDSMVVEVRIGAPHPDTVDRTAVLDVLPHGTGTVEVVEGGLEIPNERGTDVTIIAHAAAIVRLELP